MEKGGDRRDDDLKITSGLFWQNRKHTIILGFVGGLLGWFVWWLLNTECLWVALQASVSRGTPCSVETYLYDLVGLGAVKWILPFLGAGVTLGGWVDMMFKSLREEKDRQERRANREEGQAKKQRKRADSLEKQLIEERARFAERWEQQADAWRQQTERQAEVWGQLVERQEQQAGAREQTDERSVLLLEQILEGIGRIASTSRPRNASVTNGSSSPCTSDAGSDDEGSQSDGGAWTQP